MKKLYLIHENRGSLMSLLKVLDMHSLPYEEWIIDKLDIDLSSVPPQGVYYNCISSSAPSNNPTMLVEMTGTILSWLRANNRCIINGRRALQLELKKTELYTALCQSGIRTPKTIIVNNSEFLVKAARKIGDGPYVIRPNQSVCRKATRLVHNVEQLNNLIAKDQIVHSPDGITLIQEYIEPPDRSVIRLEFIGSKFYYALRSFDSDRYPTLSTFNTTAPISSILGHKQGLNHNEIIRHYKDDKISQYRRFFEDNKMDIGSIEYVTDKNGNKYVYDVSTHLTYDQKAEIESRSGYAGYERIADFLYGVMESRQILSAWARAQASNGNKASAIQNRFNSAS